MELKKAIGQLFTVGFEGMTVTRELKNLIHEYHIGGVILFANNVGTAKEILQLTNALQKEAKNAGYVRPLLISIDEENGFVKRIYHEGREYPGALALSATNDPKVAYEIGKATGEDLKALGINWNYAPVLDINNNPSNPVIGVRSFGETPERVVEYGVEVMKGLQSAQVGTAIKHFPGHGDTSSDSHFALPVILHDLDRLHAVELKPFKEAIKNGADCILTAHIVFPALEPEEGRPATLSKNIITGLLREELGFDGVIVTDALEMKAIADTIGVPNGAVQAIQAGVDQVLVGHFSEVQLSAIERVIEAVEKGEISRERIEESNQRMNRFKDNYLNWDELKLDDTTISNSYNNKGKKELAHDAYLKSVTILKEGQSIQPTDSVLILQPIDELRTVGDDPVTADYALSSLAEKIFHSVESVIVTDDLKTTNCEEVLEKVDAVDHVILGTMVASEDDAIIEFANHIAQRKPLNIVSMKNPYIGQWIPNANTWFNLYEPSRKPVEIALRTLLEEMKPTGQSPITLNINKTEE